MHFMIVLLMSIGADASGNLEQDYLRRLARVTYARQIPPLKSAFEALKVARIACRLQLREKQVPTACYESLNAEIRWGLHPSPSVRQKLRAKLDVLCSEAAESLKIPPSGSNQKYLSEVCRREVRRADEIRLYRQGRPAWSGY